MLLPYCLSVGVVFFMRGKKRRRAKGKKRQERIHAQKRALQRYGIDFSDVREDLIKEIQEGKGVFLYKQSNRVTIWALDHEDKQVAVAYDKVRKEIITFLPPETVDAYLNPQQEESNA